MSEELVVVLPADIQLAMRNALARAGEKEIGGILMAEHLETNLFVVREITVQRRGTFSRFIRGLEHAIEGLAKFFANRNNDYRRFNYLGEWHSHPLFSVEPSGKDHQSMHDIVNDPKVGANFIVLIIVKLTSSATLQGSAHYYVPSDTICRQAALQFGEPVPHRIGD